MSEFYPSIRPSGVWRGRNQRFFQPEVHVNGNGFRIVSIAASMHVIPTIVGREHILLPPNGEVTYPKSNGHRKESDPLDRLVELQATRERVAVVSD